MHSLTASIVYRAEEDDTSVLLPTVDHLPIASFRELRGVLRDVLRGLRVGLGIVTWQTQCMPIKRTARDRNHTKGDSAMTTTANPMVEQFKAMVREEWTDAETVAAWRKWKAPFTVQTHAAKEAIIAAAQIAPGQFVLDIASGTGEPALTIAAMVGSAGHVTATDLGAGMLAVAEEDAHAHGLKNLTFQQADAHALPFADASFDRVTCRFGAMYFADSPTAFREIHRVLKPGGRAAFVAWGTFDANPMMMACIGPFFTRVAPPPPPPGAPTPFKFAPSGTLAGELRAAGFTHVDEETQTVSLPWPGPPEELWQHFRDIAAPFRPLIDGLSEAEREAAIGEVLAGLRQFYDGERVNTPASIVVASAVR